MNHPNLQELATRIHAQNKAAGWWDVPRPRVQTAWLVVTELAEATEAERKGRYTNMLAFETDLSDNLRVANTTHGPNKKLSLAKMWKASFELYIKDTFEDEIADAVIRLLDFAASEGKVGSIYSLGTYNFSFFKSVEDWFFNCAKAIDQMLSNIKKSEQDEYDCSFYADFNICLSYLADIAKHRKFDLWKHVELKLKYNATRPKMHGKKF